jgi:hypothetical protein
MKTLPALPLALLTLALSPLVLQAADDAELRKQRMEAQKERQERKNERNAEIRDATQQFRQFAQDLKNETREKARELDTGFQLKRVELNADHQARMAEIDAEYQTALTSAYARPAEEAGENMAQLLQEKLTERVAKQYELEKQAAEELHKEKIAVEENKNELWAECDRRAIEEAESLGLTGDYEPILAEPIGSELTTQEQRWNDSEQKEVVRLKERNEKLLSEFRTGAALRSWELANLKEDFEMTWQEKAELRELEAQAPLFNPMFVPEEQQGPEAQQQLMAKLAEIQKEKRLIQIKYDKFESQKKITRSEERKKILAGK